MKKRRKLTGKAKAEFLARMKKGRAKSTRRRDPAKKSAKFERCVRAVKKKGTAVNPWAVCHASLKKTGRDPSNKPVHLLTDWSNIACRKREVDTSKIYTTRNPAEVTCEKCKRAQPHYDWARLEEFRRQGGRDPKHYRALGKKVIKKLHRGHTKRQVAAVKSARRQAERAGFYGVGHYGRDPVGERWYAWIIETKLSDPAYGGRGLPWAKVTWGMLDVKSKQWSTVATFRGPAEAEAAVRRLRMYGADWAAAEYRVVPKGRKR